MSVLDHPISREDKCEDVSVVRYGVLQIPLIRMVTGGCVRLVYCRILRQ
jgi:hypothetical protein